jgi:myo-inositol-1(or 4)-monophosphatase
VFEFVREHVNRAGALCTERQRTLTSDSTSFKGPKDLVTVVDREVEEYLVNKLMDAFPEHGFIREEGDDISPGSQFCWVIDPIDGTTSFAHGQPYYSISVGLMQEGRGILGVIYSPALKQFFHAERGKGAFLNDSPISVSPTSELHSSVLATGFACLRSGNTHNNLDYFNRLMPKIRDIRRCGSAALDLAYVAAGKYDGFWELNLNLYDIAAGTVLVEEAGGTVCDFRGGDEYPERGIVATNGRLTEPLLDNLS